MNGYSKKHLGIHPRGISGWLGSIAGLAFIVALLMVGAINESGNCRRDNTQNCILVQHVWELGL